MRWYVMKNGELYDACDSHEAALDVLKRCERRDRDGEYDLAWEGEEICDTERRNAMWQVQGFKTLEEAKAFQKEHGGLLCWEERTPKRKQLTRRGKEYLLAAGAVGLNKSKYPYLVEWRI